MFDVIFNLAFFMVLVGGIVFMVSFAGCIGALRENMCFLKLYSICLLLFFLAEMGLAALGRILHYYRHCKSSMCSLLMLMVSFAGCIGALWENMRFLKLYSICLLLFFLAEMVLAALGRTLSLSTLQE